MTEEERQKHIKDFNALDILYIMSYVWNTQSHDYGSPVEFSLMDVNVLEFISANPGCIITDIATYYKLTLSAASKVVTRLVKKGVIEKRPAPGNKKNINMILTPLGLECLEFHAQHDEEYYGEKLDRLRSKFSDEELKAFFDVLNSYMNIVHEEDPQPSKDGTFN